MAFFHLPTDHSFTAVRTSSGQSTKLQVAPVPSDLPYDTFVNLAAQAHHTVSLDRIDLIFCRTLKPFPPGYLAQLKSWERDVKFVNRPSGIEEQIQADFLHRVAGAFTPEMLVTQDAATALAFFEQHQVVVAKWSNSCGGRGVFKIWYANQQFHTDNLFLGSQSFDTFEQVMDYLQNNSRTEPIQFVRYLSGVDQGDKRIVVVDGEIYGAYVRRSKSGHWVNNVTGDGECILAEVTAAEKEAIAGTVAAYGDRGLHTLGYDFLMDETGTWRISEINAGNIGGFARLELLTQQPVMARFVDWLIAFGQG